MKFFNFLLLIISLIPLFGSSQCNGAQELCAKRYSEVAFLTTHNAYNSTDDGFNLPNQNNNITKQLEDGVRAFMIDVYNQGGVSTVYHGVAFMGTKPFRDLLLEIKSFMDSNSTEIISLIIESHTTSQAIEEDLNATELMPFCFSYNSSDGWPTLGQMVTDDKRLVVFSESDDGEPNQAWYHYVWDYVVETHYSASSQNDFSCDYNRGTPGNELFLINHFITDNILGTGSESEAAAVNANPLLHDRVFDCMDLNNEFPNFVALDFYELGDGKAVVDELNSFNFVSIGGENKVVPEISLFPIPTDRFLTIRQGEKPITDLNIYSASGKLIQSLHLEERNSTIDLGRFPNGIYLLNGNGWAKKVVINR